MCTAYVITGYICGVLARSKEKFRFLYVPDQHTTTYELPEDGLLARKYVAVILILNF
jgi:hypothetical protein